jgi:hypothetical protein
VPSGVIRLIDRQVRREVLEELWDAVLSQISRCLIPVRRPLGLRRRERALLSESAEILRSHNPFGSFILGRRRGAHLLNREKWAISS